MTDHTTILALASRVEAATGAEQREMLEAAFVAVHGPKPERVHGGSPELLAWLALHNPFFALLQAGGFLDAAMSLVPSGLILRNYQSSRFVPHSCEVALSWAHGGWLGNSDHSFALALTAACLRARAMLEQDNG